MVILPIPSLVLNNLKKFVVRYVYGSVVIGCAETRAKQWKKMKEKSTQRLMPDDDTLNHICVRANYLAYCQKNFHLDRHPSPIGNGWEIMNSKCRPVRYLLPPLPPNLVSGERYGRPSDNGSSSESEWSDTGWPDSTDTECDE